MFRALLLVALGRCECLPSAPGEKEWEELFLLASRQGLGGVLWRAVGKLPAGQMPPDSISRKWQELAGKVAILNDVRSARCRHIARWVEERGERAYILKGEAFSRYYADPSARYCGDIDIWVPAPRRKVLGMFAEVCRVHGVVWQECKADFWDAEALDVHFWPAKMYNPVLRRRMMRFCADELSGGCSGSYDGFPVLSQRFDAVYCLLHIFRHLVEGGLGLRQIVDLYHILLTLDGEDRSFVYGTCVRLGMKRVAADVMYVLETVLCMERKFLLCKPDPRGGRILLEEIRRGGADICSGAESGRLGRALKRTGAIMGYGLRYPREILWAPGYKVCHFLWRKCKGYEKKYV